MRDFGHGWQRRRCVGFRRLGPWGGFMMLFLFRYFADPASEALVIQNGFLNLVFRGVVHNVNGEAICEKFGFLKINGEIADQPAYNEPSVVGVADFDQSQGKTH